MEAVGFGHYVLSEQDTGPSDQVAQNSSATEWCVAFYDDTHVRPASDLAHGFLASDTTGNPKFDRVPYAFSFRAGHFDFVLISVDLRSGDSRREAERRKQELAGIKKWVDSVSTNSSERDYIIILGDRNIESGEELGKAKPGRFESLNTSSFAMTNTNVINPKPYARSGNNPTFQGNPITTIFFGCLIQIIT